MPTLLNPQMMRSVIMDHYEHPRNKRTPTDPRYLKMHQDSVSCVDNIFVYLLVENGVITDCAFDGVACTISTASTSMMTELLIGQTFKVAMNIYDQFLHMIREEPYDETVLGDSIVFMNTGKQAARIKCATIGWNGVAELLKDVDVHGKKK